MEVKTNLKMKIAAIALIVIIGTAAAVYGATVLSSNSNHNNTVDDVKPKPIFGFLEKINGTTLAANTTLPWGTLEAGTTTNCTYSVLNSGGIKFAVTFTYSNLPNGWILTWAPNATTLNSGDTASGLLQLTPSPTATGAATFLTTLTVTETA